MAKNSKHVKKGWIQRVLVPMVMWYMAALGQQNLKTFNDGMRRYRRVRNQVGPDIRVIRLVLKTGWATSAMADTMLGYLKEELTEAYADGRLSPETAPMIVRLDEWPPNHPLASNGATQQASGLAFRPVPGAEVMASVSGSQTRIMICMPPSRPSSASGASETA